MIKAIFFDFDGVLTLDANGSGTTCRNLHRQMPELSFDDLFRCYRANHGDIMLGKATHADVWHSFCTCVGTPIDSDLLDDAFRRIPVNEKMFDLCRKLHQQYTLGIITDNGIERFTVIEQELQLSTIFDSIILSGKIGSRKNESHIFEKALASVSCQADECIFIDNYEKNLIVPAKMGFKTIWHNDEKNDIALVCKRLQEYGCRIS